MGKINCGVKLKKLTAIDPAVIFGALGVKSEQYNPTCLSAPQIHLQQTHNAHWWTEKLWMYAIKAYTLLKIS